MFSSFANFFLLPIERTCFIWRFNPYSFYPVHYGQEIIKIVTHLYQNFFWQIMIIHCVVIICIYSFLNWLQIIKKNYNRIQICTSVGDPCQYFCLTSIKLLLHESKAEIYLGPTFLNQNHRSFRKLITVNKRQIILLSYYSYASVIPKIYLVRAIHKLNFSKL